jgi:dTDP-3-amino-3,4,6-trideoxy-alpha-D-glucose transaminase
MLPVHLYGQPADLAGIQRVAARHNLALVEDCCQAHLATAGGCPVGTFGAAGAFSFYPTKNLGALGDGGAVITNDRQLAERIGRLRNGGQVDRYRHQEPGINSRLDEIQAAVLRVRLPRLRAWTDRRRTLAGAYRSRLADASARPVREADPGHVYHLFVVRSARRDHLQHHLRGLGIETLVHYPVPLPRQPALAASGRSECPRADAACGEVLSLPLHPGLAAGEVIEVAAAVRDFH